MPQNKKPQQPQPPQPDTPKQVSEKTGLLRFFREMGSALVMALIAIVYVIQAFQIPTGSMEDSLLVGDFLLGLKFVYGAPVVPFSQDIGIKQRFPAITKPKPGDVVIFRYPGADKKDYIKRMVAGPGDIVEMAGNNKLIVNSTEIKLPPRGKYTGGGRPDPRIINFAPLRIPAKGDVFSPDTMPIREFLFFKTLVHQENPTKKVSIYFDLYVDGELANNLPFYMPIMNMDKFTMQSLQDLNFSYRTKVLRRTKTFNYINSIDDWTILDNTLNIIRRNFPDKDVEIEKKLFINNTRVNQYTVQFDNYFMAGDNRDNSLDSRYWGYLNRNFVKAKAFILYFSLDRGEPLWKLPLIIRWNRIGKLIRDWDGVTDEKKGIKY